MTKNTVITVVAIAALCAALTVIFAWNPHASSPADEKTETRSAAPNRPKTTPGRGREGKRNPSGQKSKIKNGRRVKEIVASNAYAGFSPEDRRLCEELDASVGSADYQRTLAAARLAASSTNTEVRLAAVEALGWFGEKALVDLVPMMGDADGEVASAAVDAWEIGLMDVESSSSRLDIARLAVGAIADRDALSSIGSQFVNAATEQIDEAPDEAAATAERIKAVQVLVDLMGDGKRVRAEVARELYEDLTGFEWRSIADAERYLADPDNYVSEDSEE